MDWKNGWINSPFYAEPVTAKYSLNNKTVQKEDPKNKKNLIESKPDAKGIAKNINEKRKIERRNRLAAENGGGGLRDAFEQDSNDVVS